MRIWPETVILSNLYRLAESVNMLSRFPDSKVLTTRDDWLVEVRDDDLTHRRESSFSTDPDELSGRVAVHGPLVGGWGHIFLNYNEIRNVPAPGSRGYAAYITLPFRSQRAPMPQMSLLRPGDHIKLSIIGNQYTKNGKPLHPVVYQLGGVDEENGYRRFAIDGPMWDSSDDSSNYSAVTKTDHDDMSLAGAEVRISPSFSPANYDRLGPNIELPLTLHGAISTSDAAPPSSLPPPYPEMQEWIEQVSLNVYAPNLQRSRHGKPIKRYNFASWREIGWIVSGISPVKLNWHRVDLMRDIRAMDGLGILKSWVLDTDTLQDWPQPLGNRVNIHNRIYDPGRPDGTDVPPIPIPRPFG